MSYTSDEVIKIGLEEKFLENKIFRTEKRAFCMKCDKPVDLISFEKAVDSMKTSFLEVFRSANMGKLHRIHNKKGKVMICAESFFQTFDSRQTQKLNRDLFITNPSGNLC